MPISYSSQILGQIINTRHMDMEMPPEFIKDTFCLLRKHFGSHHNVFHLQDIESIMGKLGHIATTAPWLCFLLPDQYTKIAACLKIHHTHLHLTNKHFCTLLKLQKNLDVQYTTEHWPWPKRPRPPTYCNSSISFPNNSANSWTSSHQPLTTPWSLGAAQLPTSYHETHC